MELLSWLILGLSLSLMFLLISLFLNFKLTRRFLTMEEIIDNSLDKLDTMESSLSDFLQKPLFFNSPEVRSVVENIKITRGIIMEIADAIQYPVIYEKEEPLDEEEFKRQLLRSGNIIRLDKKRNFIDD